MTGNLKSIDWNQSGVLSIVVQGALFQTNLVETANHCRHWREMFPVAELILVVSVTDVVSLPESGSPTVGVLSLIAKHRHDGQLKFALDTILASCNKVAFAPPALPLPPIKSDSPKLNNINFQIEAARHGLTLVTGCYVLRIRADMVFMSRGFLDQYAAGEAVFKGTAVVFRQRVMISWLFTLNPYTNERMPLHFSDWFHFGLTTDVCRLWQAPPVTLQDSVYYRTHRHAAGSNAAERLFNTRLAVEQHIIYACFKPHFPELQLDYHNDQSCTELALNILIDNFTVCDIEHAGCIMDKYASEFTDTAKLTHCITRDDWFAMAAARDVDHRITLMPKIMAFHDLGLAQSQQSLPRTYGVHHLRTTDARVLNQEIVAVSREGKLFWGPYTGLPQGAYRATVHVTSLEGSGGIILRVSMAFGQVRLAEKCIDAQGNETELTVDFDAPNHGARDVEIVCEFDQLRQFAVSGVTFAKRTDLKPALLHQQNMPRTFGVETLSTRVGRVVDGSIVSTGKNGTLFYGPYATLPPGRYFATVNTSVREGAGIIRLKATLDFGNRILAEKMFILHEKASFPLQLAFDVSGKILAKFEVTCDIEGLCRVTVSGLVISERPETFEPSRKRTLLGLFR